MRSLLPCKYIEKHLETQNKNYVSNVIVSLGAAFSVGLSILVSLHFF